MSWEDIVKREESESNAFILKSAAEIIQLLRNSMVGSENQTMSAKDVDMYLKSIKENILKVKEKLQ